MLYLHRAERSDTLADVLADILATPLADPMRTEIVSVAARGMERWLQQHVARRLGCGSLPAGDGIAANIDFAPPAALTDTIITMVREAGGTAAQRGVESPSSDRWTDGGLVWPVLAVLDDHIGDPEFALLARHVGAAGRASAVARSGEDDARLGRRYATARHIAELFERYGRQRPAMLVRWADGDDSDGTGAPLVADMAWQPRLWRAVAERIAHPHPALELDAICARLRAEPHCADLPERLSVFGPTRIPESFRLIMDAVAQHRDVHLFVPHPGPALWDAVNDAGPLTDPCRADRPIPNLSHPLLASLSRDVQELQQCLARHLDIDAYHEGPAQAGRGSLLHILQRGLRVDRLETGSAALDASLEIHSCHGADRQVEVLRDRLLHLFAADETLEPRDVVVMCPDVETFAPLVRGAFGQPGLGHPAFDLRVRLADRGPRHVNPVLDVLASVVEFGVGRMSAADVVDVASRPPVRARFAFTDDDLEVIRDWLANSNIRWGMDASGRVRFGLGGFPQGTFATGLDRIALGAVADEDDGEWLGTALPLAGVESTEIDLLGRFAEFVDRLDAVLDELDTPAPRSTWVRRLVGLINRLTDAMPDAEWQRAQAIRLITQALIADDESDDRVLRLADIRDVIGATIAARAARANFRTGELTVCGMVPMRAVPHRVIILLGIDADSYPRARRTDGDDVLGRVPLVGERDPRDEDRQLFLDALGAATDNLLVFYSGADPVDGNRIPPAVVVSELAETVATLCDIPASDVIIRHSLHGFDRSNFETGTVATITGPLSFDAELLAGAQALDGEPVRQSTLAAVTLAPAARTDLELTELISFLTNPIEGFVRQRLGARIIGDEVAHADELDVSLSSLDRWAVGDRFLRRMLGGEDLASCQAAELRRGNLPPFELGRRALGEISQSVGRVFDAVMPYRTGGSQTRDVLIALPDGRRLTGSVADVFSSASGTVIVSASYSRLGAKARLGAWLRLLAVAASAGVTEESISAVSVGRSGRSGSAGSLLAAPDNAVAILAELVAIRDRGLQSALPLPLEAAADYAARSAGGTRHGVGLNIAQRSFESTYGAAADPYVRLVLRGDVTAAVTFGQVLAEKTPPGSSFAGITLPTAAGEPLFCGLARCIWEPLLACETTP
ncbi:MAG: exodeoxyribonuclease V subunit gamma [Gordonia sp. (in: high G+C Gram-positive bacteria)]